MNKMSMKKANQITGDYGAWLHTHLQNKDAACAHVQVALDAYQSDQNKEALLLALKNVAEETRLNREHLYYLLSER